MNGPIIAWNGNFQRHRSATAAHYDGWIYYFKTWPYNYFNPSENGIYKERFDGTLDGTDQVKLSSDEVYSLTVVDGWLYYTTFNESTLEGPFYLYKMSLDGKTKIKLLTLDYPADVTYIDKDWIYYSPSSSYKPDDRYGTQDLYKMSTDGKNKTFIATLEAPAANIYDMQVVGDYIYYKSIYGLHRIKEDGSELYASNHVFTFSIKGNDLYFLKQKMLHRYDLTTGEVVQLTDEPTDILILGDYIYSSISTFKDKPKLIKIH